MRICLVVRALPIHRSGGLEFHTWDLARALAGRGHELVILTSSHPQRLERERPLDGLELRYLAHGRPGDYSLDYFRWMRRQVAQLAAEWPFDVLHAQEFAGLFLAPSPGRFVCTIHGTMFSETPLYRDYLHRLSPAEKLHALWRYKARAALHPFFVRMLRRMQLGFVDSDFTRRELLRIDPELRPKLRLVPLGIDLSRYQPSAAERPLSDPPCIALLGRVQKMKGLDTAVEAAALLRQRGVAFRMVIGGQGDYSACLTERIRTLSLEQHVELRGRIPSEQMSQFLDSADLFLFPDKTQPAFGLVAIEAMLHGLPVVAARSGAIPEVVTDEVGWIYNPWNAGELAALLERVLRDPAVLRAKAAQTRARASCYSAASMAEGVERGYRALLSPSV